MNTFFIVFLFILSQSVYSEVPRKSKSPIKHVYSSCGPASLFYICQQEKIKTTFQDLCIKAGTNAQGTTLVGLAKAAHSVGLEAVGVKMDYEAVSALKEPAIAWVDGNHYVAVLSVIGSNASIYDSARTGKETIPVRILLRRSHGIFLLLGQ